MVPPAAVPVIFHVTSFAAKALLSHATQCRQLDDTLASPCPWLLALLRSSTHPETTLTHTPRPVPASLPQFLDPLSFRLHRLW